MIADQLAVIGLGSIGGSLARALIRAGAVNSVVGYDIDPAAAQAAFKGNVIDRIASSPAAAAEHSDVVILSVPVMQTREALAAVLPKLKPGAVVTDVGSTKGSVLADLESACGQLAPWFVAGHPIAGTEKSGAAAANPELFKGRRVILTPHAQQDAAALARVRRMWEAAGSVVIEMDARHHDEVLAATSHLPHLLAYTLVEYLAALDERREIFAFAAGGFRDFTRIASSSPQMWHDIVRANREAVLAQLDGFSRELAELRAAVAADDGAAILDTFQHARAARERYLELVEKPAETRK